MIMNVDDAVQKKWFEKWFNASYYYDLYAYRNEQEAINFIDILIDFLKPQPQSTMLDVGCGRGRHVKTLSDKGFNVTGIDISPAAIDQALIYENDYTHFFVHDMRLPFWINYFDYVFNFFTSFGYFNTLREHHNTLQTMAQALHLNGCLIIDYLNVPFAKKQLISKIEKTINGVHYDINKYDDDTYFYKTITVDDPSKKIKNTYTEQVAKFSLTDFREMLSQHGLEIKEVLGNYSLESYNETQSPRMIMIAQKYKHS